LYEYLYERLCNKLLSPRHRRAGASSRLGRASNNNINKPGSVTGSNFNNYS
jgi:hypothetical protein